MKQNKLATTVIAITAGITLSVVTPSVAVAANDKPSAAVAANDKSRSDRPLPPKCNPKYKTAPGDDCLIMY